MSDLPAPRLTGATPAPSLGGFDSGAMMDRVKNFAAQPAVRKMLPWFAGAAGIGLTALAWAALSAPPQRVLYAQLDDLGRAEVAASLDQAGIEYTIDAATGAMTVAEDDLHRARMMAAANGSAPVPNSGTTLIDSLPIGASRTLEGDRLRAAQEHELQLTIMELDGIEAVRVHLAKPERSVFIKQDADPSASVMLRLHRGASLTDDQVAAIANLVAAAVPGMQPDAVKIVDQRGRLLSSLASQGSDGLDLQARMEAKLRAQLTQLLTPIAGANGFATEVQVELDMSERTSARESYDKDGVIRRESTSSSATMAAQAIGVPGVLANAPPADADAVERAPEGTEADGSADTLGQRSADRTFELDREVSVTSMSPGQMRRVSVAVVIDEQALPGLKDADIAKIEELVAAAIGANRERGDQVSVVSRKFRPAAIGETPFWEASWFATALRNGVALIAAVMFLVFGVRPLVKSLNAGSGAKTTVQRADPSGDPPEALDGGAIEPEHSDTTTGQDNHARTAFAQKVDLVRRISREQPDDALHALRAMLSAPEPTSSEGQAA